MGKLWPRKLVFPISVSFFFFFNLLPSKGEQTFANPRATTLIMESFVVIWMLLRPLVLKGYFSVTCFVFFVFS